MTIVGATYQTILNRLMLQSWQLCDVARDFRCDPRNNFFLLIHQGKIKIKLTEIKFSFLINIQNVFLLGRFNQLSLGNHSELDTW
jgi:hypothetical protein